VYLIKIVAHSRGREIHEITSNNFHNEIIPNILNIRTNSDNRLSVSNNNYIPSVNDINRPIGHLSHSYIIQGNNAIDNSNINAGLNLNSSALQHQSNSGDSHIDDIFDQLTYAVTTEKHNLKHDKANLLKEKKKFLEMKSIELQKLQREREEWKEKLKISEEEKSKETDILDLDIGGTQKITTTRATLIKVL